MQIERETIPESTIEQFGEAQGLVMQVRERGRTGLEMGHPRYYASFKGAEVKDGPILIGEYGNGNTEAEAIRNYAARISERLLVIGAYTDARREIRVPRLV